MSSHSEPTPEMPASLRARAAPTEGDAPAARDWNRVTNDDLAGALAGLSRPLGVPVRRPRAAPGPVDVDPVSLAESIGLIARRVELPDRWWRADRGPLVVLAGDSDPPRPVALIRRGGRYRIVGPDGRPSRAIRGREARSVRASALSLAAPLPESPVTLVRAARFAIRPWRADTARLALFLAIFGALGLSVPIANRRIIDQAIPDADWALVVQIAGLLVAVNLAQAACHLVARRHHVRVITGAIVRLQLATWHRLIQLPGGFFRDQSGGDLVHRGLAVTAMGQQLGSVVIHSAVAAAIGFGAAAMLVWIQPMLALVAFAFGALEAGITALVSWRVHGATMRLERLRAELLGTLVPIVQGIAKLRVAGAESRAASQWWPTFERHLALLDNRQWWLDQLRIAASTVPAVASVAIYSAVHRRSNAGPDPAMSLGGLMAFLTTYGLFAHGLASIGKLATTATQALSLERLVRPIWHGEPEVTAGSAAPGRLRGRVRLHDVAFRYHDEGPRVLENVSFEIAPGEFVAITGPSGGGKSSLIRLLLGLARPVEGIVSYDGHDLSRLDARAVRRQIGSVLQQSAVFAGTLFDNIAGGRAITMDEAWAACVEAELADDIAAFPMGMYTLVADRGANLSGGQRQRLLIARALVGAPAVVVFDEATSALSPDAQQRIMDRLARRNVTRVVVAHRMDAVRDADRMLVVDHGRVVESKEHPAPFGRRPNSP
ncbi:MAG: ATP-binding cassette domain-containing protein [Planctomycetes bacterium]|nr:ATP-binding cassette domain-containing protein [Planctomycetota bacterium]